MKRMLSQDKMITGVFVIMTAVIGIAMVLSGSPAVAAGAMFIKVQNGYGVNIDVDQLTVDLEMDVKRHGPEAVYDITWQAAKTLFYAIVRQNEERRKTDPNEAKLTLVAPQNGDIELYREVGAKKEKVAFAERLSYVREYGTNFRFKPPTGCKEGAGDGGFLQPSVDCEGPFWPVGNGLNCLGNYF